MESYPQEEISLDKHTRLSPRRLAFVSHLQTKPCHTFPESNHIMPQMFPKTNHMDSMSTQETRVCILFECLNALNRGVEGRVIACQARMPKGPAACRGMLGVSADSKREPCMPR